MNETGKRGFTTDRTTIRVDDTELALEARSFSLPAPFGGFVWNRPVAVVARTAAGETRLPVVDVTRRRRIALYAASAVLVFAGLLIGGRTSKE